MDSYTPIVTRARVCARACSANSSRIKILFFFSKKKEKKKEKKMEGKLSPPMARLIFRAVLARTKSRGVSQQVRLYEFVQSNKVCLARDTYDPPFSSSATKQWNIHRINMYTHTRQNFKNRSVFFSFLLFQPVENIIRPIFFFFPLFFLPFEIRITIDFVSARGEELEQHRRMCTRFP